MEHGTFDPLEYLSIIRRRKWWLITPLVVALVVGVALALLLPKEYTSSATLAVTAPSLSSDLVRSSSLDREERVRALSQQLMSPAVLQRVAREEGLAAAGGVEAAADHLRARVVVALPPAPVGGRNARTGSDTFLVSYTGSDPEQAMRVTNRVADVFVDEHSRSREARAEETAAFLAGQLRRSQQRLGELEERLRRAKEAYIGRLPEQTSANLQMLAGLRQQLDSNATAMRGEQDRLSIIERQIEEMEQGAAAPIGARGAAANGGSLMTVITLEQQLADARMQYTDRHPEVQRLTGELEAARRQAAAERERPLQDRVGTLRVNAVYRQLLADRDRARLRVRDLQRGEQRLTQQISAYQARVESAPMVEQELTSLSREYQLEKDQYAALSAKHNAAVLAEDLERKRGGEQFSVLYRAYLPDAPSSPNQLRILLIALGLGFGLGVGLVVLREYLDRSVYDGRSLEQQFGIPVLGEIPRLDAGV